jgi:hypothetical protein
VTIAGRVDDPGRTGRHVPSGAYDGIENRRELLSALRRIAVHLETAELLEGRADRSASPPLADVLRERAAARRRTAGRLRADLAARGVLAYRPRSQVGTAVPLSPPSGSR